MTNETDATRTPSLLDASCEVFVRDMVELSPTEATALGYSEYNGELQDFSPEYWEAVAERQREMLGDVDAFDDGTDCCDDDEDFDDVDIVTAEILRDRLGLELELYHHYETVGSLNNIASPVQIIRESLLLLPHETAEEREAVAARLSKVDKALHGYRESLSLAVSHGHPAVLRQVENVVAQCRDLAKAESLLCTLGLDKDDRAVTSARKAFGSFADWLSDHLAPHAIKEDAVGRERYQRFSHLFVGDVVDLDDAYTWGRERLREIEAEQLNIARELYGEGVSVADARERLNAEPRYTLQSKEALRDWMQGAIDEALRGLHGQHFDIAEPARRVEACIDPAGTGLIYYTPPSNDFSRPGRAWWSVPASQKSFHTWQELSTVYHESVPGHHLQFSAAMANTDLNTWRRSMCWISGYGEGWALYAEQLMQELGYLDDPGYRMGMLDAQRLRAARVVLDIGVHLGKTIPDGSSTWDASFAKHFLEEHSNSDAATIDFELNRYLGWPGQAPSYALGQRLWQQLRVDALAQGQSLAEFHAQALDLGAMPMSVLRSQVLSD